MKPQINVTDTMVSSNPNLQSIYALCSDLAEIQSQIDTLEQEKQKLRNALSTLLASFEQPLEFAGVARVELAPAIKIVSYDRNRLDLIVLQLHKAGQHEIASQIEACRRTQQRAGGLRMTRLNR
jgi:hypothetical protein